MIQLPLIALLPPVGSSGADGRSTLLYGFIMHLLQVNRPVFHQLSHFQVHIQALLRLLLKLHQNAVTTTETSTPESSVKSWSANISTKGNDDLSVLVLELLHSVYSLNSESDIQCSEDWCSVLVLPEVRSVFTTYAASHFLDSDRYRTNQSLQVLLSKPQSRYLVNEFQSTGFRSVGTTKGCFRPAVVATSSIVVQRGNSDGKVNQQSNTRYEKSHIFEVWLYLATSNLVG